MAFRWPMKLADANYSNFFVSSVKCQSHVECILIGVSVCHVFTFVPTPKWSSTCIYSRPLCLWSSSLSSRPLARLPAVAWKSVYILTSGYFSFHGVLLKDTPTREVFPHHCISSPNFLRVTPYYLPQWPYQFIIPTVHTLSTSLLALVMSEWLSMRYVRCYHLPVILTCISLVINDTEYFFGTYLWFTYLFGKSVSLPI